MAPGSGNALTVAGLEVPDAQLSVKQLEHLVRSLARERRLWEPLVDLEADQRHYASLRESTHLGVWVISWMPSHDTGFHDHAGSRGAVIVTRGTIREERPVWGREPRRLDAGEGTVFSFDETEIHRMVDLTGEPVVTIHAYSDPLVAMGLFRVDDDGYVRREALGWDDELEA